VGDAGAADRSGPDEPVPSEAGELAADVAGAGTRGLAVKLGLVVGMDAREPPHITASGTMTSANATATAARRRQ
jgi:hypothetical protein